jgi:hypothetical protein
MYVQCTQYIRSGTSVHIIHVYVAGPRTEDTGRGPEEDSTHRLRVAAFEHRLRVAAFERSPGLWTLEAAASIDWLRDARCSERRVARCKEMQRPFVDQFDLCVSLDDFLRVAIRCRYEACRSEASPTASSSSIHTIYHWPMFPSRLILAAAAVTVVAAQSNPLSDVSAFIKLVLASNSTCISRPACSGLAQASPTCYGIVNNLQGEANCICTPDGALAFGESKSRLHCGRRCVMGLTPFVFCRELCTLCRRRPLPRDWQRSPPPCPW